MVNWKKCAGKLALVATLVLCSCGPQDAASRESSLGFPNWPREFDNFRFHWYAAPGIDLTSGPAVAIRAYVESFRLGFLSRNIDVVYPGFLRATSENLPAKPGELVEHSNVRPDPIPSSYDSSRGEDGAPEFFGYQPSYLLSLKQNGRVYSAIVCEGEYATFRRDDTPSGKYRSIITVPTTGDVQYGDRESVTVRRIELTDQGGRSESSLGPEGGSLPAPLVDVFGPWFVTAASTNLWGPLGDAVPVATPELQQQCFDHMPDDEATRRSMYSGFRDAPPAHGDPIPGWPEL